MDNNERINANDYLHKLSLDPRILRMKSYVQHGHTTTYDHVFHVAKMSIALTPLFFDKSDQVEICTAAVLHDYYLYDWHNHGDRLHGFHHPYIAAENAKRDFNISNHVSSMIKSHMWPLNFQEFPKCRGAWIITIADKIVSIEETIGDRLT